MRFWRAPKLPYKGEWHYWFAWYPVVLGTLDECVWLEKVKRQYYWFDDAVCLDTIGEPICNCIIRVRYTEYAEEEELLH